MQNRKDPSAAVSLAAKPASTFPERNRRQSAQYIADMTLELHNIANVQGLFGLQHLLEVSYYEDSSAGTDNKISENEQKRLKQLAVASSDE
jgi:hypothetical protein